MEIETTRLKIIALTPEQLEILADDISRFEDELKCLYQGQKIEGIFKNILYAQSLKAKANRNVYLWLTFWLIIKKEDNIVVGMIDFKNVPNTKGEVEIGYGLGKPHEHFGYMTEAVQAFCKWGKEQKQYNILLQKQKQIISPHNGFYKDVDLLNGLEKRQFGGNYSNFQVVELKKSEKSR